MAVSDPIYAVHAEAVPVMIYAHQLGRNEYRIRFSRGIGWAPTKYRTEREVLAAMLRMQSYGLDEARMAKSICLSTP